MAHSSKHIYLDHHATTPCDPRVVEAMLPYFSATFGNPASSLNSFGRDAADAVDGARRVIADVLAIRPNEIIFTSGATEANNLALVGLVGQATGKRRHIITSAIEHKSILETCRYLETRGFEVTVLPVGADGRLDLTALRTLVSARTLLVSVQAANNEIGALQEIAAISEIAHSVGAYAHCDAAQMVGKLAFDITATNVDLASISAHKLYGPKGIGMLFVRGGVRNLPISPVQFGGGQEFGLRPGTLNVPGIIGFAKALEIADPAEAKRIQELRDNFERRILQRISDARINGPKHHRLPGNSSVTIPGIDAEALIANIPELALSTGSACTSGALDPSHVLLAIGLSRADALSTIRIGIGRVTSASDLDFAAERIIVAAARIRALAAA